MHRALEFIRSDDVPLLARTNYRLERLHMAAWGVFAGLVEGNTSSIVVAKTFNGSPFLVAFVVATPMLANLLSLLWGVFVRGRSRRSVFLLAAGLAIACIASVGLTPQGDGPWAGWLFAGQLALARIFLAGLITVRTSIWGANYPTAARARITGRLQGLRFLVGLVATAAIAALFTRDPDTYRLVYPAIAAVGALSLLPIRRIRVRKERLERRRFRELQVRAGVRPGRGFYTGLAEAAGILRNDREFSRYCTAQYLLGSAALMTDAIITIAVTTRLYTLVADEHAPLSYLNASILLDLVPAAVLLLTIPFWARYFDRVGVLRFRVINSAIWFGSLGLATAALAVLHRDHYAAGWLSMLLLAGSRLLNGAARSGGAIAWNLGHLHFAGRYNADLYMGIHVALTGLRGILMPFVGLWTYEVLDWYSLLIATALALAGLELFRRLAGAQSLASAAVAEPGEAAAVPDADSDIGDPAVDASRMSPHADPPRPPRPAGHGAVHK